MQLPIIIALSPIGIVMKRTVIPRVFLMISSLRKISLLPSALMACRFAVCTGQIA